MIKTIQTITHLATITIFAVIFSTIGFKFFANYTERTLLERFDKVGAEIEQECIGLEADFDKKLEIYEHDFQWIYCLAKCEIPSITNVMEKMGCTNRCTRLFKDIDL